MSNGKESGYFSKVARRLLEGFGKIKAQEISDELIGAHHHHIAKQTGLVQTLKIETVIDIIPFIDPVTDTWKIEHPEQEQDILSDRQGGNIQTLAEALDEEIRYFE